MTAVIVWPTFHIPAPILEVAGVCVGIVVLYAVCVALAIVVARHAEQRTVPFIYDARDPEVLAAIQGEDTAA